MDFEYHGHKVGVGCTWGDGPDVCINIKSPKATLKKYTDPLFVALALTGDEAITLGLHLIRCGQEALEFDRSYLNWCVKDLQKKEKTNG